MRIPHNVVGRVRPSAQPLAYLRSSASAGAFGVGIAQSVGRFGEAINSIAEELDTRRKRELQVKANGSLVNFELQMEQQLDELNRNSNALSNIDHTFSQTFVEGADSLLKDVKDRDTQEYMQNQLLNLYGNYQMKAQGAERSRNEAAIDFELTTQFETAKNIVLSDPSQREAQLEKIMVSLTESHGILPRQLLEERTRLFLDGILESEIEGRIRQDPEGVLEELHNGVLKGEGDARLLYAESGGNPRAFNEFGFAGLYQFGAPRLADIGVYTPGKGEPIGNWNELGAKEAGKWSGTFNIPGHPNVKTVEDFLVSPSAQHTAFRLHKEKMDKEILENGFEKYLGQRVGGVLITRQGLQNMIHLGGVGGAKAALSGKSNPKDANGVSVLDYARMGSRIVDTLGGLNEVLSPGAKKRLIAGAEAEIVSRSNARDKAMVEQDKLFKMQQEDNTAQLHVGMAHGMVSETQLVQALHQRAISTEQYRTLRSDLEASLEDAGDPEQALNMRVQALQGGLTASQVMADRTMSLEQKQGLVDLIDQVGRQGAVFAQADVKAEMDRIDSVIGGLRGPLAIMDTASSERVANAMQEFRDKVQADPTKVREIADEVIQRYRPQPSNLQSLPAIPQWSGPRFGTKLELEHRWAETKRRIDSELDQGSMNEAQYMQSLQDLMRYREAISNLEK